MIDMINLWFTRAKPNPTPRDLNTQLGCHFEEVREFAKSLKGVGLDAEHALQEFEVACERLATGLKRGDLSVEVADRREFLDGACDQVVTAVGSAYMAQMAIEKAVAEVVRSNWSKAVDGQFVFDENGKIAKPPTFSKPDFTGMY